MGAGLQTTDERETGEELSGTPGLRIVVFSSLFPNAAAPNAGSFIRERMFRVARRVPVVVVAPMAWSPLDWLVRRFRPGFRPPAARYETMDGIDVFRPRYLSLPGILKGADGASMALGSYRTVRRLQEGFRPTLIDAHFVYPDGYAATRIGRRLRLPVAISIRGSKDQSLVGTGRETTLRRALAAAQGLIAVSEQLVQDVAVPLGVPAGRVVVIGNGVDTNRFRARDKAIARRRLGLGETDRVLVGVGNRIPLKGFQRVIPLLVELRQEFPGLKYLVVGGPGQQADYLPALQRLAEDHGVADMVRFCGPQPPNELAWHYAAADVFVLATAYEGWANVLLEAMACGLPVVTTRVGGNPQVVASPDCGILVDYWDPKAFSRAIGEALRRPWDRAAIRTWAKANDWEARIDRLIHYLAGVAERGCH